MSTIYLIAAVHTRENYTGRDYEVIELDHDDVTTDHPYFTSREDAEAYIDKLSSRAEAAYQSHLRDKETQLAEWETDNALRKQSHDRLAALAQEHGIPFNQRLYLAPKPHVYSREHFGSRYQIITAESDD